MRSAILAGIWHDLARVVQTQMFRTCSKCSRCAQHCFAGRAAGRRRSLRNPSCQVWPSGKSLCQLLSHAYALLLAVHGPLPGSQHAAEQATEQACWRDRRTWPGSCANRPLLPAKFEFARFALLSHRTGSCEFAYQYTKLSTQSTKKGQLTNLVDCVENLVS